MTEHNIWFWFLEAINDQVQAAIVRIPAHSYMGLAATLTGYAVELTTIILRYLGLFIPLRYMALMLGLIVLFELFKIGKKLIMGLFGIIKFFL